MTSTVLELFIPIIISNILHMFVVKKNYFSSLDQALSTQYFGANKTYRGFIFVTLATAFMQMTLHLIVNSVVSAEAFTLGALLGFVFMLFELPNSFFKRRRGILAGESSESNRLLYLILDKSDSTFGVCFVYVIYKGLELQYFFYFFISAFILHLLISKILYFFRIKASL